MSNQRTETKDQQPKKKKRGPIRRVLRLITLLVVLAIGAVLTLPLWGSTGPGTSVLTRVASLAVGQAVQAGNLDLGYGGSVLIEDLRVGDTITVEKVDVVIGLIDLMSNRIRLKGTITRPAYVADISASSGGAEGGGGTPAGRPASLPDARVELSIVGARAEIRHPDATPPATDRVEELDAELQLICDRTLESLSAELSLQWELVDFGGFAVQPSTLAVTATPSAVSLAPSHLQVAGGTVDVEGQLTLDPGSERLVCKLTADGVQPPGDNLQPIRGVDLSADLTGLDWIRGAIETGELGIGHLEILRRLNGSVKVAAKQLNHRLAEPLPVLGQDLVVSGLDGKVFFDAGVIRTENMNLLLQDTGVSADLSSTAEGPVTFSLRVAGPGQPAGRLPVKNLAVSGTAPFSADSAKLEATLDQLDYEEMQVRAVDLVVEYARDGDTHRADIGRCSLEIDGARVGLSGQAAYDANSVASYVGKATIDGYRLAPELQPLQGAALDLDLSGIPTTEPQRHLDQLRGKLAATVASLPTAYADLQKISLAVDFDGGNAFVRSCKASSRGGSLSASGQVFLGATPGDVRFEAQASGLTLEDSEGPIQNFVATGNLTGFTIPDGLHQPKLGGTITGSFDSMPLPAVTLDKGKFDAVAKSGRIDLTIFDFAAGPGRLTGKGFADLAQEPPEWSVEFANDKVGVRKGYGNVLSWVVPILAVPAGSLGGTLESTVQLAGRGFAVEDLRKTLTGSGHLTLSDGFVSGSPILQELVPLVQGLDLVGIESINASFDIGDGLVRSDDLDMNLKFKDSPLFFGLKGSVDFDTNIDYGIKMRTIERLLPANLQPVLQLLGEDATIPLHLQGTIAEPRVGFPSPEELMQQLGKSGLEKLTQDPGKLLDGILGGQKKPAPEGGEKPDEKE